MYRKDKHYGLVHLCPWNPEDFEYDGACSHNSIVEPVPGDFSLSKEELEKLAAEAKETNRLY
jgi:hypothetical protein